MDERDAWWHIAQVVPSWLAISWETDGQPPSSAWPQPLDKLFERVDHRFPFLDNSRNRPYAAAFEQQPHRWSTAQIGPPASGTKRHQFSLPPDEVANRNSVLLACFASSVR